ncbi:MAG: DUF1636 domain-containing protein [Synechococcaceae cyanobacterium SM2_3_1]|nr:DUF1636 domain-containing protein [Synechococcaceae cyanobacterium SM2_3_1]
MSKHALFVCESCFFAPNCPYHEGETGGRILLNKLSRMHREWHLNEDFTIKPVKCMSACQRPCAVAISGPQKTSCIFGDMPPLECAPAILKFAEHYHSSVDGFVSRVRRPDLLRKTVVARIPPLPFV